jgi:hypothetical protein
MKRFLMLVGVAVVAAAMYVAASPASQQAKGPTAKQFNALKKQVAALKAEEAQVKKTANNAAGFIATCFVSTNAGVLPVNEFGDAQNGTFGYQYKDGTGAMTYTTALDIDTTTPFQGAYLQGVDPTCVTTSLRHRQAHSGSSRLPLLAEHAH